MLAVLMTLAFSITVNAENTLPTDTQDGAIVILQSNDVHGEISGYQYMAGLKNYFAGLGADVILVDSGDFSQGTIYVSESSGGSAVQLMNEVGYDIATLGNHEFDFGIGAMNQNITNANFRVLCTDIINRADGTDTYPGEAIIEKGGVKIGFLGIATPETQTKTHPKNYEAITFLTNTSDPTLYADTQAHVDDLKAQGADLVIAVTHLGVDAESDPYRSTDLLANVTGIDMVLDGHSHTVMDKGENDEPIMSTGTKFNNVGVVAIDKSTKKIITNYLIPLKDKDGNYLDNLPSDPAVKAVSDQITADIDEAYGQKIAESKVELNGCMKKPEGSWTVANRTGETNLGDLIADSFYWYVMKDGTDIGVPAENIVVITNGGGIRAPIHKGDVSKQDIKSVVPFGNTLAAVAVTGEELLEALEASTQEIPIGGFPQIKGMNITIDESKPYDKNDETYPDSTYYGPKTINRVTIDSVNGKPFDPAAKYVVITNDFCMSGGDTYYVL
jgi:2',3'-cyclic-nucleotide 2'-phosphodiesterase (5'-nucleotidase family)